MHVLSCTLWGRGVPLFALVLVLGLCTVLQVAAVPTLTGESSLDAALDRLGQTAQEVLAPAMLSAEGRGKGKGKDKKGGDREYENGEMPPVRDTVGWVDPRLNGGRLIDVSILNVCVCKC